MTEEKLVLDLSGREERLYDRLRAQVAVPRPGVGSGLRDLLLLIPDGVVFLLRLLRDDRVPLGAKGIAFAAVGYILSPIDILPEILLGPLGLVDDLLVLAAGISSLVNHVHPDLVRYHWPGQEDALDAVRSITNWAERTLTDGVWRVLRRLIPAPPPAR